MKKRILFRCDGGQISEIGLGHVVRCVALAQECSRQPTVEVQFLVRGTEAAFQLVRAAGFPLVALSPKEDHGTATLQLLVSFNPDIIVVDCWQLESGYLPLLKKTGVIVATLDYTGADRSLADLSVNAILPTGDGLYEGYDYLVLPKGVAEFAPHPVDHSEARRVFVSFGGYDPANLTHRFAEAAARLGDGLQYDIVVSRAYQDYQNLQDRFASTSNLHFHQDPPNYTELLHEADIALVSGGLTMFQSVASGIPTQVIAQYPHQVDNVARLEKEGVAELLGRAESVDFVDVQQRLISLASDRKRRERMALAGRVLVDGLGLCRVSQLIGIIDELEWDSNFFGMKIATLYPRRVRESIIRFALEKCAEEKIDCLYYLCDCHDPESIRLVEKYQFHFVDIRLEFFIHLDQTNPLANLAPLPGVDIRLATEKDIPELCHIAEDSYIHSRYFFDRHFPTNLCRRFYADWIAKSARGQFEKVVWVAEAEGKIAGYISCTPEDLNRGRIGLVGIAPLHRGKGLGRCLIKTAFDWFLEKDLPTVGVVTQGRNIAAQRLYQSCGFRTENTELWYHKWFGDTYDS